jgi:hypothetical protein
MKVNSGTKVANLNADKFDDKDSSDFVPTELYIEKKQIFVPRNTSGVFSANCDQGDVAISGGYGIDFPDTTQIRDDRPSEFSETWLVNAATGDVRGENLEVYVRCADLPPLR